MAFRQNLAWTRSNGQMAPGRGGNHTATTARLNLNVANHYATLGADIEARGALQFGSGFSMGANGIYYDKALNDINAPTTLWGLAPGALFNGEVIRCLDIATQSLAH